MKTGFLTCLSFIGALYIVSAQDFYRSLMMLNALSGNGGLFGAGESNPQPSQQSYSPPSLPVGIPQSLQAGLSQIASGKGGKGGPSSQPSQPIISGYNPYGSRPARRSQPRGGNGLAHMMMAFGGSDAMKNMFGCQFMPMPLMKQMCLSQALFGA